MDELYWHQSDLGGWAVYRVTENAELTELFSIMGSRWDLLDVVPPLSPETPSIDGLSPTIPTISG